MLMRCPLDSVFFFRAEDGIRDWSVTGVQTCALPIYRVVHEGARHELAVLTVDELLEERLRDSLREPAVDLARDDERTDAHPAVVHRHEVADPYASSLRVELDHRDVRAERINELGRAEELRRLESRLEVGWQLARVSAGRDLGEAERAIGYALHLVAAVGVDDVHGRRLEHVGGDAPGLVLDPEGGLEDGGAADGEAAAPTRAVAHRGVEGIAVADDDLVEVHPEVVGDDLGERRLVPLTVRRGARDRRHRTAGLGAHDGRLERAEAAHLHAARRADTEQG